VLSMERLIASVMALVLVAALVWVVTVCFYLELPAVYRGKVKLLMSLDGLRND
jgi:hypothetical protein